MTSLIKIDKFISHTVRLVETPTCDVAVIEALFEGDYRRAYTVEQYPQLCIDVGPAIAADLATSAGWIL